MDASPVLAGRAESDPSAASAFETGQGNGDDPPAVLSVSSWGRLPPTVRGRTRSQSQRLEGAPAVHQVRINYRTVDALRATAYE